MNADNRNAAIAALIIVLGFGFGAYFLPSIMLELGSYSTVIAGIFGFLFVAAFFLVFWLRGRYQRRHGQ
jgi:uncharacterized membrane protein